MKLSIITINYNNAAGLEKTIASIVTQTFTDFEYIVIDGSSSDGSVDVVKKYADKINYWVSEPDKGIYNAMNKGIRQATGEYLLFINSGDSLHESNVLQNVFSFDVNSDLIYGNLEREYPDGHKDIVYTKEYISLEHMLGDTIPHPVCFIRKSLFNKYGLYREDLKIISDWAFFLKIIAFGKVSQTHLPIIISTFMMDGMSNDSKFKSLMKKETKQVFADSFSPELLEMCVNYRQYHNFYYKLPFRVVRRIINFLKDFTTSDGRQKISYAYQQNLPKSLRGFFNSTKRKQLKNPLSIPIIIINYNRLADLQKLVNFLIKRNHTSIVIVDNMSTYPPLMEYYNSIQDKVTIKIMDNNYGHLVFWKNKSLFNEYAKGYYIITDSDIIPNDNLPDDYINRMIPILEDNPKITKVGFALQIDDIPDSYIPKQSVIDWEKQFWKNEIGKDMFLANLDTTFAIYHPHYMFQPYDFYSAIRLGGNFTAKHGGWYIDSSHLSDEDIYYAQTANASSSWKVDEDGKFAGQKELYN